MSFAPRSLAALNIAVLACTEPSVAIRIFIAVLPSASFMHVYFHDGNAYEQGVQPARGVFRATSRPWCHSGPRGSRKQVPDCQESARSRHLRGQDCEPLA